MQSLALGCFPQAPKDEPVTPCGTPPALNLLMAAHRPLAPVGTLHVNCALGVWASLGVVEDLLILI